MKKIAATILAFFYLAASTGATIHLHYCMGKLVSAGLWHSKVKNNACSACGMAKKKGCCEDKHTVIKIGNQYATLQASVFPEIPFGTAIHRNTDPDTIDLTSAVVNFPLNNNSPPGSCKIPLYIAHCVYRI